MIARYLVVLAACSPHASPAEAPPDADPDAAAADAAALVDAPPAPSTARYFTQFNWPRDHGGADTTITNELVRMIDATPPGALIRGNFFELGYARIATALDAAYDRGVTMRITIDGNASGQASAALVASHMGTSAGFCGSGASMGCITSATNGIAHSKFMTFSQTRAPDGHVYPNVVWFGSYNAVDPAHGGSGDADSNSATSIYDAPIAYQQLVAHQTRMQNQVHYPGNDYYDRAAGRGYFYDDNARLEVHLSPEAGPNLIYQQLLRVTADPSCIIRVFQVTFSDSVLPAANQLATLAHGGCQVFVVADIVGPQVASVLGAAGIEIRRLTAIHDKVFLVDAKWDGSAANRRLVFTGSHNWENKASYGNDELLASIEDPAQYQAFYAHFLDAWHAAPH